MDSTIYKKIESYLMSVISQNAAIPDFKLPSERMLSITFNASRNPVRHAYNQLIKKGYVTNIHGRGYFISSRVQQDPSAFSAPANPKVSLVIPSIRSQYSHDILAGRTVVVDALTTLFIIIRKRRQKTAYIRLFFPQQRSRRFVKPKRFALRSFAPLFLPRRANVWQRASSIQSTPHPSRQERKPPTLQPNFARRRRAVRSRF